MESVGIIIIARDTNSMLLLHRVKNPIVWSSLSGKMEKGENPIQTIKREIKEEIGVNPTMIDNIEVLGKSGSHYVVVGYVDEEFKIPNLKKNENDTYGWFNREKLPSPMHPKWSQTFKFINPILRLREGFKKMFNNLINEQKFNKK